MMLKGLQKEDLSKTIVIRLLDIDFKHGGWKVIFIKLNIEF